MPKSDEQIVEQLKRATAGLLYMSESDYPFEVIQWQEMPEVTSPFIRSLTGESEDSPIHELEVENFLTAERYKNVVNVLRTNLSNAKAYKVGRINIPVYVVGRSPSGRWLGVSTRVVQT